MKVYILLYSYCFGEWEISAIYKDKETAEKCCDKYNAAESPLYRYMIEEYVIIE